MVAQLIEFTTAEECSLIWSVWSDGVKTNYIYGRLAVQCRHNCMGQRKVTNGRTDSKDGWASLLMTRFGQPPVVACVEVVTDNKFNELEIRENRKLSPITLNLKWASLTTRSFWKMSQGQTANSLLCWESGNIYVSLVKMLWKAGLLCACLTTAWLFCQKFTIQLSLIFYLPL